MTNLEVILAARVNRVESLLQQLHARPPKHVQEELLEQLRQESAELRALRSALAAERRKVIWSDRPPGRSSVWWRVVLSQPAMNN